MPKPLTQTTGRRKAAVARVRLRPFQDGAAPSAAVPVEAGEGTTPPAAPAPAAPSGAPSAPTPPAGGAISDGGPGGTDGAVGLEGAADAAGAARVVINGRPIERYFPSATHRMVVTEPLRLTDTATRYLVEARIDGGGVSGQAGALRLGIARALADVDPDLRVPLKRAGLLTRDAREKESKKYGLKKARKAPQYSKR